MSEILIFNQVYEYDTLKTGITVTATLSSGAENIEVRSKIDTGASFCIFERRHAERLGITVEDGEPQSFGTATGSFTAYGHEIKVIVLEIEVVSTVYFAAEESFNKNVLGQTGWLNKVKLGLIDYDGKLFLSHYNE